MAGNLNQVLNQKRMKTIADSDKHACMQLISSISPLRLPIEIPAEQQQADAGEVILPTPGLQDSEDDFVIMSEPQPVEYVDLLDEAVEDFTESIEDADDSLDLDGEDIDDSPDQNGADKPGAGCAQSVAIDDATQVWVYSLRQKSDVFLVFQK